MTIRLLTGDVRSVLRTLPADHYDCVITSPPYWGLRDYGVVGQLGLEPTLVEHLATMVDVFGEVKRVLKPGGTLWLNYGDCYATTVNGRSAVDTKAAGGDDRTYRDKPFSTVGAGLKPKDLCMIPNRLAIALQEDGWWVRSEVIWGKPNAMPDSSGVYRPATAHEKIFLLTKSDVVRWWVARDSGVVSATPDHSESVPLITNPEKCGPRWIGLGHYYNAAAVRIERAQYQESNGYPGSDGDGVRKRSTIGNKRVKMPDGWDTGPGGHGGMHRNGREKGNYVEKPRGHSRRHAGFNDRWDEMSKDEQQAKGRLLRNYEPSPMPVWNMATAAFREAHFATFPPELVERCLAAGCPPKGRVLDPFGGAGTTGLVADRLGHDCDLIDLNPDYIATAEQRLTKDAGMFSDVAVLA